MNSLKKNKVNNPNSIIMCVKFPGRLILHFLLCFHIQSFILSYSYNSTMTTIFNRTCKTTTILNRTCNGKLLKIKINKSKKKFCILFVVSKFIKRIEILSSKIWIRCILQTYAKTCATCANKSRPPNVIFNFHSF